MSDKTETLKMPEAIAKSIAKQAASVATRPTLAGTLRRDLDYIQDPETGRWYPVVAGGSTDDPPKPEDTSENTDTTESTEDSQPDVEAAVKEATKKANAEAAKFRKQRDENAAELERLREQAAGKVDESEVQKAAREAAEKAAAEFEAKLARKESEAQLYRDYGKKFRNPADALAFIDLDSLDGTLDEAVTALLDERPYLAVDVTQPSGSNDAGSRTPAPKKDPGEMSVSEYQEWRDNQIKAGTWGSRR